MQILHIFEKKRRSSSEGGTLDFEQPSNGNHGFSSFRAYKKHEKRVGKRSENKAVISMIFGTKIWDSGGDFTVILEAPGHHFCEFFLV